MAKANRLAHEASPYLLQHADNPVDWWPWSPQALDEAQRTGRPILLSVGYAACHWCHVMAHESFEDDATAAVMNERYVNIKVDREERPDIDQIYMAALHATGEQGGWPLTMFLTSDGAPFFGGTYFPKEARFGRARFVDVLNTVADTYRDRAEAVAGNVEALRQRITAPPEAGALPADAIDQAATQLLGLMDPVHGGTRGAPKFPNAALFELLWRAWARTGDTRYRDAVATGLTRIARGGITDHVGGGMARYSVDERWLVPHFEKMLYDNAQIISLMSLAAAEAPGRPDGELYRCWVERAIGWADREMRVGGLYAASLDADTEGQEGRYYVWSLEDVRAVLGDDADRFAALYDVTAEGNFEGTNVLNRLGDDATDDPGRERFAADALERLSGARDARTRPGRDDKLLADWNGLMIAALATAGAVFGRADWTGRAAEAYAEARHLFADGDRLIHAVRGEARTPHGFALDHACLAHAALTLVARGVEVDGRDLVADAASDVAVLEAHHVAGHGGYHWTADDAEALYMRPDSPLDEAVPNANGVMVGVCATLWALTAEERYEAIARRILAAHAGAAAKNVFGCASLFNGLDQLDRLATVTAPDASGIVAAVRRSGHPAAIVLPRTPEGHPAAGTAVAPGAAIVCRGGACSLPLTGPDDVLRTLWRPG